MRGRCHEASQLRTYSFNRYLLVKGSLQLRDLLQEQENPFLSSEAMGFQDSWKGNCSTRLLHEDPSWPLPSLRTASWGAGCQGKKKKPEGTMKSGPHRLGAQKGSRSSHINGDLMSHSGLAM